jgi:hypothetical protein
LKYFKEAKFIWQNYVPKSGQSETVQGELLRVIEKLRYEAQNNGNGNWDRGFEHFCDYIWKTLSESGSFESNVLVELKSDLDRLRDYIHPYLDDDLYDRVTEHIVEWYLEHKEPIKREIDPNLHR